MKMKHSLIALAVGAASSAAVVTPAAAGDVTVYGRAQVEIAVLSNQQEGTTCDAPNQGPSTSCDGIDILDNAQGRVGFKASEDLGHGMKGLAKFEFKADTADNDTWSARESLVGLKAGWGQVELGNLKSAYKYYGGVKYDPFVSTTLQARGNGGMSGSPKYGKSSAISSIPVNTPADPADDPNTMSSAYGHNGFLKNQLGYQYTGGPIKFRVTYGLREGSGDYSLGLMYKVDKWEIFGAAVSTGDVYNDGGNGDDLKDFMSYKLGGAFKLGAHKFMAQYEQHSATAESGGEDFEPTHMFLGWNMKMGKNVFVVQGGMYDADDPDSPNYVLKLLPVLPQNEYRHALQNMGHKDQYHPFPRNYLFWIHL